jgi:hypothetical protein
MILTGPLGRTFSYFACILDGRNDELKLTQDGLGWVCGEDIDVTQMEEEKSTNDDQNEERKSLEDEIGEG